MDTKQETQQLSGLLAERGEGFGSMGGLVHFWTWIWLQQIQVQEVAGIYLHWKVDTAEGEGKEGRWEKGGERREGEEEGSWGQG